MQNQTVRLFLYSSLAIVALTLVWGFRSIPRQGRLAEDQLRNSLEQELIVLSSAVKSSTAALKFRLLDVLKAEGNDHPTRAFQESPFASAALLEWDGSGWKVNWHSTKLKDEFQSTTLKDWLKDWPLAKLTAGDEAYYTKVNDVGGQAYFALVVPVRKPGNATLLGVGVFPAAQFGLTFSADQSREVRVFNDKGFALALARPAYVGASLLREPIVTEILEGDTLNLREEWKSEAGISMLGMAQRLNDSNLFAAIETKMPLDRSSYVSAWLYLVMCAIGAVAINWVLFSSLVRPLFEQLAQTEEFAEKLRRQLAEGAPTAPAAMVVTPRADAHIPTAELPDVDFIEPGANAEAAAEPNGAMAAATEETAQPIAKAVGKALRVLDGRLRAAGIGINKIGLENVAVEADMLQLQTAIEEILKNAIEAMQDTKERQLTIAAHADGRRYHLTIEDTGSGIAPENLRKVFDPFFSTRDTQGVARGLGLNVVRRVVEELQGTVQVRNRGGGGGVIVEIEWPRHKQSLDAVYVSEPQKPMPDPLASDLDILSDEAGEDFASMPIPSSARPQFPPIPIRKPKVRALD